MKQHHTLCTEKREVINKGKWSKINKLRPVKNINKNPQSLQKSSHMQKQESLSYKLKDHA